MKLNSDSFNYGDLHVMLLVDMDVVNEIFWTSLLPWSVKKHLEEVFPNSSRKRRAARIVDGINCTPYDIAHQRGYLHAIVFPHNYDDVESCLPADVLKQLFPVLDPLSSGQWGQGYIIYFHYI